MTLPNNTDKIEKDSIAHTAAKRQPPPKHLQRFLLPSNGCERRAAVRGISSKPR